MESPLVETDLPLVEGLPAVIDETNKVRTAAELDGTATPSDQSQVLGNDHYHLAKTLIESDQVGGQIHYELHLDVLKGHRTDLDRRTSARKLRPRTQYPQTSKKCAHPLVL